ncbi:GNAT family N-acetyltransferase [Paenibacillus sp. CAU 1782]
MGQIKIIKNNMNENVSADIAGSGDVKEISETIFNIAVWLKSQGIPQWGKILQGEDSHNVPGAISRGEVIVFRSKQDGGVAGACILQQQPSDWDFELWGKNDDHHDTSVYLHRLVVDRRYSGQGIGPGILAWIEDGVSFEGKDRIRLDCIAWNTKLNEFYASNGYAFVGAINGFNKYQKML